MVNEFVNNLNAKTKFVIFILGFAGQLCWAIENQFFNVYMYNEITPEPLYISLMVAFSAITSTLTTIFIGALSDARGKRKIFFLIGYSLWPIATAMFPLSSIFSPIWLAASIAIAFDCLMTFFGAMATDAALTAYSVDVTNISNRGKVTGILELVTLLATLITYGLSGYIIEAVGYANFFYIIAFFVGLLGISGAFISTEPQGLKPTNTSTWVNIKTTFQGTEIKKHKDAFILLIAIGIWAIGFNVFFPFIMIYLQHKIQLDLIRSSILMFLALFISIIAAIPMGKVIDKVGRKKMAIIAVISETISLICFALTENFIVLAIFGCLWIYSMMVWDISSRTWIKDLYPDEKRGQFSGYFLLFSVLIGMTVGPLIGGLVAKNFGTVGLIDEQIATIPNNLVFIVGALIIVLAIFPLKFTHEKPKK